MQMTEYGIFGEYPELMACTVTRFPEDRLIRGEKVLDMGAEHCGVDRSRLAVPGQVHGNRVMRTEEAGEFGETDGCVSLTGNVYLSLRTADCIPLFIYSPKRGKIGLIHAGWRGVVKGIEENALDAMELEVGEAGELRVALGPAIRSCCYEVQDDVAGLFPGHVEMRGGRMYLDLQGALVARLEAAGLKRGQMEDSSRCTCCHRDTHYSYRCDKTAHRMVSLMGVRQG